MPDNHDTDSTDKPGSEADTAGGLDASNADAFDDVFEDTEDETDDGSSEDARKLGERLGSRVGGGLNGLRVVLSRLWTGFLYAVTSALGTDKVWQARFKKNIKRMYKATDADAIAFVARKKGDILPTPVKYRPPGYDGDDDEENPHGYWEAGHMDQTFTAATGANATETINNIPVVFLHSDDWAESSFSGALLGEAVDLGKAQELYQNPTVNVIELTQETPQGGAGAVADGGAAVTSEQRIENGTPGALKDVVVDVESVGQHDGTRVQWEKFKDLRLEQTTVEEMNQAQERGRLAGLREAMGGPDTSMIKWFVLGMVALGLGAFWLGAKFGGGGAPAGGGGGGGGGVMPFYMTVDALFQTATLGVGWL